MMRFGAITRISKKLVCRRTHQVQSHQLRPNAAVLKDTPTKSWSRIYTPRRANGVLFYFQLGDEGLSSGGNQLNSIFITAEGNIKGVQILTPKEQQAGDTMQVLKVRRKTSIIHSLTRGSSEGTGVSPWVPTELTVILTTSSEGTESEYSKEDQGNNENIPWESTDEDEEKKDNDDADDDKSIDLEKIDDEETQDELDEEMKNAKDADTRKGNVEITDTTKAVAEKTEEVKDDITKVELPSSSSSLSISLSFNNQFLNLSFDTSLIDFLNTSESSNDNTNVINAPQEPFVFNQDLDENSLQSPPHIDHHCCYGCGDSLDSIFWQRCTCESCGNDANYGYNCPPKVSIISNPKQCCNQNVDEFPQTLPSFHPTCYSGDENSFTYDCNLNFVDDAPNLPLQPLTYSYEFCRNDAHYGHDFPPQKIPIYYDDDDGEEIFTPLRDIIISKLPPCIATIPVLSTEEPNDSLIMGDEHLDTIPEKELDEFIKSSVENLVPSPSESEDISDGECDLPLCDDFAKSHLVTFSNPFFDIDNDFTSSDDESFFKEDVPIEYFKIFSNPLFDLDEEIISTENHCLIEILRSILLLRLILFLMSSPVNLFFSNQFHWDMMKPTLIRRGIFLLSRDCFMWKILSSLSPSHIPVEDSDPFLEEIDLFLASDGSIPLGIDSDYSDSKGDNLFPERLLHDDHIPLLDILDFSNDIRVLLPFFTYPVTSLILLFSRSKDTIFDLNISNYHFSSLEPSVSH
uniref:Uncharacterized protein n=1 Tax=Tanacetum cinerariifolium TaxID=118510 RepID=A0A6L2K2Y6_TANCI|nr:hypothetical protein [Tanacetum cinerariifolium]